MGQLDQAARYTAKLDPVCILTLVPSRAGRGVGVSRLARHTDAAVPRRT